MSLRVDDDELTISQAAAFLNDPQGIRAVLDAIDRLADEPWVKTMLAPGSEIVMDCCERAGLVP